MVGCASTEFTAYEGGQQDWPIGQGAMVNRHYRLPVYYGPPPRPYEVIGYVDVENARASGLLAEDAVASAVSEAARRGADAIVLTGKGTRYAGTYSTANVYGSAVTSGNYTFGQASGFGLSTPLMRGNAQAVAIRWKNVQRGLTNNESEPPAVPNSTPVEAPAENPTP